VTRPTPSGLFCFGAEGRKGVGAMKKTLMYVNGVQVSQSRANKNDFRVIMCIAPRIIKEKYGCTWLCEEDPHYQVLTCNRPSKWKCKLMEYCKTCNHWYAEECVAPGGQCCWKDKQRAKREFIANMKLADKKLIKEREEVCAGCDRYKILKRRIEIGNVSPIACCNFFRLGTGSKPAYCEHSK